MNRLLAAGTLVLLLGAAACSDDDDGSSSTTTTEASDGDSTTTTTEGATTTEAPEETTTTSGLPGPEEAVAAGQAWLDLAFPGNTATVGEFQQGDSNSGELPVFRSREDGTQGPPASTLLIRLNETEWEVIGAVGEFVTIEEPTERLIAGPNTVSGIGRGFEATLVVRVVDTQGAELGTAIGQGGSAAEPLPYAVEVDLSGATVGAHAYVVVNGGVGLEGDTGEFAAVRLPIQAG